MEGGGGVGVPCKTNTLLKQALVKDLFRIRWAGQEITTEELNLNLTVYIYISRTMQT